MKHLLILVLTLGLPLAAAVPATAQETETEMAPAGPQGNYGSGFAIFQRYCRSCHGTKAEGDGHVAKFLKIPPPDLTRLQINNGGEFPTQSVLRQIDGREEMVALHGRDMPIWGAVFQVDDENSEREVAQKLSDLVAYLEGIQVEQDGEPEEPQSD